MQGFDIGSSPLVNWIGLHGLPRFDAIHDRDFGEAFKACIELHKAAVHAIANNPEAPSFINTITALELSDEPLTRVSSLFWHRAGADTSDVIQDQERLIAPILSRHYSEIGIDPTLFNRINVLWENRDALSLTGEERQVLERYWKNFIKSGAKLAPAEQARLVAIKERLSSLSTLFGQNVLADEKSWVMLLSSEAELVGLPDFLRAAMAVQAETLGKLGQFALTLSRSIIVPFLTFSVRRDLREQAFQAWISRGANTGATDNRYLIAEILKLREEEAKLLGYETFADKQLDGSMAKTPDAAMNLMRDVWRRAVAQAQSEESEIAALIAADGSNHQVMPWDWRYYAEKIRSERYSFSESELKPYLQLDRIVAASFRVAERLFGIKAVERHDVPLYHSDVRLFEIYDHHNRLIALFLGDYFARSSKRSGAWMSSFQKQDKLPRRMDTQGQLPIIYNVCNFSKPAPGKPALLSLDDARTVFHEFGHALHGILSNVTYPSVSGTAVSRDFVELPSQLYEHWLTVSEILQEFAVHCDTGQPIPLDLLQKVLSARTFNAGFNAVEFTASALVDMAFHTQPVSDDPLVDQARILADIGLPQAIAVRHSATHFNHVFSGGYAAQYYSYQWSEVLDADAFSAFEEAGDPFDADVATRLKANIYSTGGSLDPAEAYIAFRGRLPTTDAMLKKKGLVTIA